MSGIIPEVTGGSAPTAPVPVVAGGSANTGPNGNPARLYFRDEAGLLKTFDHYPAADGAGYAAYYEEGETPAGSPFILVFSSAGSDQAWWRIYNNQSGGIQWNQADDELTDATGQWVGVAQATDGAMSEVKPAEPIEAETSGGSAPVAPVGVVTGG